MRSFLSARFFRDRPWRWTRRCRTRAPTTQVRRMIETTRYHDWLSGSERGTPTPAAVSGDGNPSLSSGSSGEWIKGVSILFMYLPCRFCTSLWPCWKTCCRRMSCSVSWDSRTLNSRLGEAGLFSPGGVSLMNVPFDALSFLRNTFYQQLLDLTKLTFYIYWGICR